MPAHLAAIGGGQRLRAAHLTAVYVAGVLVRVLPITLGAAALASDVSRRHPQTLTIGGLMMIGVAVGLRRERCWCRAPGTPTRRGCRAV